MPDDESAEYLKPENMSTDDAERVAKAMLKDGAQMILMRPRRLIKPEIEKAWTSKKLLRLIAEILLDMRDGMHESGKVARAREAEYRLREKEREEYFAKQKKLLDDSSDVMGKLREEMNEGEEWKKGKDEDFTP
jgi:hypothetical protein